MAWRGHLSKNLKELRILLCQSSPSSSITRTFIEKNYKDLKTLNPKLPILIRECNGIEPQLWARYGIPLFSFSLPCLLSHFTISLNFSTELLDFAVTSADIPHAFDWVMVELPLFCLSASTPVTPRSTQQQICHPSTSSHHQIDAARERTDLHCSSSPSKQQPKATVYTVHNKKNGHCRAHHPHERADWASPIATKTHDSSLQHPRRQIASPPTAGRSPRHRQSCHPATISHH
uniref:NADH dehydrogenase [ubiquinone] 1 alpha subcomplex subunit 2-like n=1 Tax=Populus alba TaxID=43335 RepID=A0A4U5QDM3_POPAL|nr:NADH dehydrogenase [ubiquinone] 1 alpha subcomplex subunit 2-like [Populus alba]